MVLWVAQGFGIGRIPFAPGTWGTAVGLIWFCLLLAAGNAGVVLLGVAAGIPLSVWLCDRAEKLLQQKDPRSVVVDEIIAVPVCFLAALFLYYARTHQWPALELLFRRRNWLITVATLILFRVFDVLKPWPVHGSQSLPGGWGVTIDDVLAAGYVNLVFLVVHGVWHIEYT